MQQKNLILIYMLRPSYMNIDAHVYIHAYITMSRKCYRTLGVELLGLKDLL